MLHIAQTALSLGCIYSLVALALFLSYRVLDIADLTTDGCFVLGMAVSVTASVSVIDITSRTTFLFDSNNANYALGYVLLADSLHNNASGWLQKNGYADLAGSIDDPNLLPWTLLPGWVPNLRFNHVPIATSGVQKGISADSYNDLRAVRMKLRTVDCPDRSAGSTAGSLESSEIMGTSQERQCLAHGRNIKGNRYMPAQVAIQRTGMAAVQNPVGIGFPGHRTGDICGGRSAHAITPLSVLTRYLSAAS